MDLCTAQSLRFLCMTGHCNYACNVQCHVRVLLGLLRFFYSRCPRSMRSRVYETVGRPSLPLSVTSIDSGRFASERPAIDSVWRRRRVPAEGAPRSRRRCSAANAGSVIESCNVLCAFSSVDCMSPPVHHATLKRQSVVTGKVARSRRRRRVSWLTVGSV